MIETTFCPAVKAGVVLSATSPTHSMPRIRGKPTLGDLPSRVKISEWLMPKPLTFTNDQPGLGCGVGTS
jgi:hypothetical protein